MSALVLVESNKNGLIGQISLSELAVKSAQPDVNYSIVDGETMKAPEGLVLKRIEDDLEIEVDEVVVARLEDFFADGSEATFSIIDDGTGATIAGNDPSLSVDDAGSIVWQAAGSEASGGPTLLQGGMLVAGAGLVALFSNSGGSSSNNDPAPAPEPAGVVITFDAVAGPLQSVALVEVYDTDGNLLVSEEHDFSTGTYQLTITNGYVGPVLVKVIDLDPDEGDYIDEATGEFVSLTTELRAMAQVGGEGDVDISITPLTELAVRLAGITGNQVTDEDVQVNEQVGELFGIDDITGPVTAVLEEDYDNSDGLSAAEIYGNALALLSGSDSETGGLDATLDILAANIQVQDDGALTVAQEAIDLLDAGAEAFADGVNGDKADLGDSQLVIPVIAAAVDGLNAAEIEAGVGVLVGGLVQGDTVTISLGDGSFETVVSEVDADGNATITIESSFFNGIADGAVTIAVEVNGAALPGVVVNVDATPPVASISLDANITADDIVNAAEADSVVIVTGAVGGDVTAGDVVSITVNGVTSTGAVTADNTFSIEVNGSDLSADANLALIASVTISDAAGNSTTETDSETYQVDLVAEVPILVLANDTGTSAQDGITNDATINVTLASDVASWEYSLDGGVSFVSGTGTSFELVENTTYAAGDVQVRQTDLAGNTSSTAVNVQSYQVDTQVEAPVLSLAQDTGTSAQDGITNDATINVTLASDVASWEYSVDGGDTFVSGIGTSFELAENTTYAVGDVQVRQTDLAGNTSQVDSNDSAILIDAVAPVIESVMVSADGDLVITFSEVLDDSGIVNPADFNVTVNDEPGYSFINGTLDGLVITLTPVDKIAIEDLVNSVSYVPGNDLLTDTAGNVASETPFTEIVNNSTLPSYQSLTALRAAYLEAADDGSVTYEFKVERSLRDIDLEGAVDYQVVVSGENAADAADFGGSLPSGTVTFAAGELWQIVTITVTGDQTIEADETFSLVLSANDTGGVTFRSDTSATATIFNNGDVFPIVEASTSINTINDFGSVTLSDGDDALSVAFRYSSSSFSGQIKAGSGNDSIVVNIDASSYFSSNSLVINAGEGNDAILLELNASSSFSDNTISVDAGAGDDSITINVTASSDVTSNDLSVIGGAGNDTIQINLLGSGFSDNSIDIQGGEGNDGISLDFLMVGTPFSFSGWSSETYLIDGGAGHDAISLSFGVSGSSLYSFEDNVISLNGGSGNDLISIEWFFAGIDITDYITNNQITLSGGAGDDQLLFDWQHGFQTDSTISDNTFILDGGEGNDRLTLNWSIEGNTYSTAASNDIDLIGGDGDDALVVDLQFSNMSYSFTGGELILDGGNGDDLIQFSWMLVEDGSSVTSFSSFTSFSSSYQNNNNILVSGGAGNDIIEFSYLASDVTIGSVSSETITITGGSGIDTIDINMNLGINASNNQVDISGGVGADRISFIGDGNGIAFTLDYEGADSIGDSISGFDASDDLSFRVYSTNFNGDFSEGRVLSADNFVSGAGAVALDSDDYWIYDSESFELYYDADGSGTESSAQLVASFDVDVALNAADITARPTAPTFELANDTGASNTDGLTTDATVNVSLPAESARWEYSLDAGNSWTKGSFSSFELGSNAEYLAADVQVRYFTAEGEASAVASNAAGIVIDTLAPAITGGIKVNEAGDLEISYSEDISGSSINLADFNVTVNGAENFALSGISVEGNVVTLITSVKIDPATDTVNSVAYSGDSIVDQVELAAGDQTINTVALTALRVSFNETDDVDGVLYEFRVERSLSETNAAATIDYVVVGSGGNPANADDFGGSLPSGTVNFAVGELYKTISITVTGDDVQELDETFTLSLSNPTGAVSLLGNAAATGTIINDDNPLAAALAYTTSSYLAITGTSAALNVVALNGSAGDDAISVDIELSSSSLFKLDLTVSADSGNDTIIIELEPSNFSSNTIDILAGEGNDSVIVDLLLNSTSFPSSFNGWNQQNYAIDGGAGHDAISLSFGVTSTLYNFNSNIINPVGGTGNDLISIGWDFAGGNVSGSITDNTVNLLGGAGDDRLTFDWQHGYQSSNPIALNDFTLDGGEGNDSLIFAWAIEGNGSSSPFTSLSASNNNVTLLGGNGNDTLVMDLQFNDMYYSFTNGALTMQGGNGDDLIKFNWSLTEQSTSSYQRDNVVLVDGGTGNDIIEFVYQAEGSVYDEQIIINGGAGIDSISVLMDMDDGATNDLLVDGGTGSDAIDVTLIGTDVTTNTIALLGGDGNDTIHLDLVATTDDVVRNVITLGGGTGNDAIMLDANVEDDFRNNGVEILGGIGADNLSIKINASGSIYSNAARTFATENSDKRGFDILGNDGNDNISLIFNARYFSANSVDVDGGIGDDSILLTINVSEDIYSNAVSSSYDAGLNILGGVGNDAIEVNFFANDYSYNNLELSGGIGDDAISLEISATGSFYENTMSFAGGDGVDTISVDLVQASGSFGGGGEGPSSESSGGISSNDINIIGGSGADAISLNISANSAFNSNFLDITGGAGADTINLSFSVGGNSSDNSLEISGGDGVDDISINLAMENSALGNNIHINGGTGADSISLTGDVDAWGITLDYSATSDFGDMVFGIGSGSDVTLNFSGGLNGFDLGGNLVADSFVFGSGAVALDSDDYWIYDTDTFELFYDADGTGTAEAVLVADFDANINLTLIHTASGPV